MNSNLFGIKKYGGKSKSVHQQQHQSNKGGSMKDQALKNRMEDQEEGFKALFEAASKEISGNLNFEFPNSIADNLDVDNFQMECSLDNMDHLYMEDNIP